MSIYFQLVTFPYFLLISLKNFQQNHEQQFSESITGS